MLFSGCSTRFKTPNLDKSSFSQLPSWDKENYKNVLDNFKNNCKSSKTQAIYRELCQEVDTNVDAKEFIEKNFTPYLLGQNGLLTGYYEPMLKGSLVKTDVFKYPIYKKPKDLLVVDLGSIYPELKKYRLRGRVKDSKLIPYYTREEISQIDDLADVICYTDSKIDLFFLEVQGSGRVKLRDGSIIFVGYDNQNGHKYRSIGKYLVQKNVLDLKSVSLQTIKKYLLDNPKKIDEVLNYNKSAVFFREKLNPATGSLGIELTPKRSVAVDRRYIKLGSMLYLDANVDNKELQRVVFAQDTGGAIKGKVRADLFLGSSQDAMRVAGELKSPLKLWVFLPNKKREKR